MTWLSAALDEWREILEVLWRRKLRTALTALSVAWGILMLVVLLATGNGLVNGAEAEFGGRALNSVWLGAGQLSRPYRGNAIGRQVALDNEDLRLTHEALPIVDRSSATLNLGPQPVRHGRVQGSFEVNGCLPDSQPIENADVVVGRYIDADDQRERRKVALLDGKVRDRLFPATNPVGQIIQIGRDAFTVIGVIEEDDENSEQRTIYVPLSTAQAAWGKSDRINSYVFTIRQGSASSGNDEIAGLRRLLADRHRFDAQDEQAVRIWNNQEIYERFRRLFRGIRAFVWLIGLGTIAAGVVGVSNIMLISVQERTREIGVRKAIGATAASIVGMILREALAVTLISGYVGLCAGVGLVAAAKELLPPAPYFRRPDVDLEVGLLATGVLVVAGALAGLFPALRAARVNPIVALRTE